MSGIRLVNERVCFIELGQNAVNVDPATLDNTLIPRFQPTATKKLIAFYAPSKGLPDLIMAVGTAGAKGSSTDLKCQYRMRLYPGKTLAAGSPVTLTQTLTFLDCSASPVVAPVADKTLIGLALSGIAQAKMGDLIALEYVESGTFNADTRPIVVPVGFRWTAPITLDPTHSSNQS